MRTGENLSRHTRYIFSPNRFDENFLCLKGGLSGLIIWSSFDYATPFQNRKAAESHANMFGLKNYEIVDEKTAMVFEVMVE